MATGLTLQRVVLFLGASITVVIWFSNLHVSSNLTLSSSSLWGHHVPGSGRNDLQRPLFAIHIGPPKTGTTYLQTSLCKDGLFAALKQDDWRYLGTCPKGGRTVPHNIHHMFDPTLNKKFKARIRNCHQAGVNVLLIFEGLSNLKPEQIAELRDFLAPWFRLRVFAAYRPLYEWLPSKYNSLHKPSRNPSARVWPGHSTPKNITGKELLPFDLNNRGNFSNEVVKPIEASRRHVTHSALLAFQEQGIDARVIHMPFDSQGHQDHEYLNHLLCNLLNITHTCASLRSGAILPQGEKNPSRSFDGDIIAVKAHQVGLIPSSVPRSTAKNVIEGYYRRLVETLLRLKNGSALANSSSSISWPIKCLSDETQQRIFRLSWETHCKLLCTGNQSEQEREEQRHKEGFERNRHRFCSADAESIIDDLNFRRFVQEKFKPFDV